MTVWELMLKGAAAQIREHHQKLSALDCVAGDGDHGSTMLRVVEQFEHAAGSDPREFLRDAGWKIMGVDGGASSSLLGIFFAGMADVPGEGDIELPAAFECGLAAVRRQTKAQPGDKTMIDAMVPAVAAMRTDGTPLEAMRCAAEAAEQGAASTCTMVAKYGRAKYLGEKTLGYEDPGARSIALLFAGFYQGLKGDL